MAQRVFFRACASALPAPDLDVALVRPSRKVDDASFAAPLDVVFLGALRCDSALPAAVFDFTDVDVLLNVLDAFDAAFLPVTFATAHLKRERKQSDVHAACRI